MHYFCNFCMPCSAGRGCFLVLPVAGRAGAPPVHYGGFFDPGRAPWRVLWVAKVARAGSFWNAEPRRTTETPYFQLLVLLRLRMILLSPRPSSYNSSRTYFFQLLDGYGRCLCVCACVPCFPSTKKIGTNTQSQKS